MSDQVDKTIIESYDVLNDIIVSGDPIDRHRALVMRALMPQVERMSNEVNGSKEFTYALIGTAQAFTSLISAMIQGNIKSGTEGEMIDEIVETMRLEMRKMCGCQDGMASKETTND